MHGVKKKNNISNQWQQASASGGAVAWHRKQRRSG